MKEEFNLLRYTIELIYIKKLNELKWWQFLKRKEVNKWRESQLQKYSGDNFDILVESLSQ